MNKNYIVRFENGLITAVDSTESKRYKGHSLEEIRKSIEEFNRSGTEDGKATYELIGSDGGIMEEIIDCLLGEDRYMTVKTNKHVIDILDEVETQLENIDYELGRISDTVREMKREYCSKTECGY